MDEPLDEQYLKWLYQQVASVRLKNPARTYWSLIKCLFTKEFIWLIPNDDNRMEDGRDLRYEFLEQTGVVIDPEWLGIGCSMLEMLISLGRRLAFESEEDDAPTWFWLLVTNMGLGDYSDLRFKPYEIEYVNNCIDEVIWRTYDSNGHGGLFPLNDPHDDQRQVELWYQMSQYLLERG